MMNNLILVSVNNRLLFTAKNNQIFRITKKYLRFAFFSKLASHYPPVRCDRPAYTTHMGLGHTTRLWGEIRGQIIYYFGRWESF